MSWQDFYLVCFLVGFGLSALALLAGSVHLHLPHLHIHHGIHVPHSAEVMKGSAQMPWFNFGTVAAFLAWFGGTGYLLTSQFRWLAMPALVLATLAGGVGAFAVFWVMAHVLWSPDENMQSADYHMVGVLGRLTLPIRDGGSTGELVYAQGGTRKSCGARSADGQGIEKGAEVIVTAYDRGIASVRRYSDLAEGL